MAIESGSVWMDHQSSFEGVGSVEDNEDESNQCP